MDEAEHIRSGHLFVAREVDQWPRAERDALQGNLRCPECGAPAYFRRGSRDGKRPCFFAPHHAAGCETAVRAPPGQGARRTLGQLERLIGAGIALPLGAARLGDIEPRNEQGGEERGKRATNTTPSPPGVQSPESRRPRRVMHALLEYIEHDRDFVDSEAKIETEGGYTWRACNLFVPFGEAAPDKRPHLYWGRALSVDPEYQWLNTGGRDDASVELSPLREDPLGWLGVDDAETDIPGARVLVFGWCIEARRGKPIIRIYNRDPSYLAIESD